MKLHRPHFNLHVTILKVAKIIEDKSWYGNKYQICFFPIHKILSTNHTVLQFFEFALIGLLGTGINFLVFSIMGRTNLAWILGIFFGLFCNFFLNKWFVFSPNVIDDNWDKDMVR